MISSRSASSPWLFFLFGALGGLTACGHSLEYTPTNQPPRALAPRDPASVEVFSLTRPQRPHVEVGVFEIEQRSPASAGSPKMLEKLRARAARIGCDALVVSEPQDRVQSVTTRSYGTLHQTSASTGTVHTMGYGHANVVRKHMAACVVYTTMETTGATGGEVSL